jgi:hypothetical protein
VIAIENARLLVNCVPTSELTRSVEELRRRVSQAVNRRSIW